VPTGYLKPLHTDYWNSYNFEKVLVREFVPTVSRCFHYRRRSFEQGSGFRRRYRASCDRFSERKCRRT